MSESDIRRPAVLIFFPEEIFNQLLFLFFLANFGESLNTMADLDTSSLLIASRRTSAKVSKTAFIPLDFFSPSIINLSRIARSDFWPFVLSYIPI